MGDTYCPTLDICAPKPRRRRVPRLYPVPYCPNAFLFRYNVKHERACPSPTYTHSKTGKAPNSSCALIGSAVRQKSKRPTGSVALIFANFTCSFCNSWSRKRFWRLSPACPTALCRFRLPRKTVCRLLWIWCFPCSLLLGDRPVFRLLPVESSMPHPVRFYTSRRGGSFSSSSWGNYSPPRTFNNKSAPSVAALLATLGVILYKSKVSGA